MGDTLQVIIEGVILIGVFMLTRMGIAWKFRKVAGQIIRDLEVKSAFDNDSAVHLAYEKPSPIRIGMRDYHSKALEYLVLEGAIIKTDSGKYHLSPSARESIAVRDSSRGHDDRVRRPYP